jgi:hypothetical protein
LAAPGARANHNCGGRFWIIDSVGADRWNREGRGIEKLIAIAALGVFGDDGPERRSIVEVADRINETAAPLPGKAGPAVVACPEWRKPVPNGRI